MVAVTESGDPGQSPELGRMRILDAKPVNLDGFSVPDPDLGLAAMSSPHDPQPSLVIRDGRVVEMDGKAPRTSTSSTSSSHATGWTSTWRPRPWQ